MSYIEHTEETEDGLTLKIVLDSDGTTDDPSENDESVIMAVLHRRYVNPAQKRGLTSEEAIEDFARDNAEEWKEFFLFMYDHSGTCYRVSEDRHNPFSCPWDSGRVGSLFVKIADVSDARKTADCFCEVYTAWANGNVYGFIIEDENGDELDSCWGFIEPEGARGYVLEAARESLAYHTEEARKTREAEIAQRNESEAREMESARPDMYPTPQS